MWLTAGFAYYVTVLYQHELTVEVYMWVSREQLGWIILPYNLGTAPTQ